MVRRGPLSQLRQTNCRSGKSPHHCGPTRSALRFLSNAALNKSYTIVLNPAGNRRPGAILSQGRLELEGVNGHHLSSRAGGADARQLDRRRNATIGEERQVVEAHIKRLDPVGTGGLDAINVRKRKGLREYHRPARRPS
jgi:hypothetical protein